MLIEYYFKIQYTKGTKNIRVDILSRKAKLQNNKKLLGAILYKDKDRLIRYNYPKIVVTQEYTYYNSIRTYSTQQYTIVKKNTTRIKLRYL